MLRRLLRWVTGSDSGRALPADPDERAAALRKRGRDPLAHGHDVTEEVVAALADDAAVVRVAAAETLAAHQVYAEIVPATAVVDLLADEGREVRLAAAEALVVTTDGSNVGEVLEYALADDPAVRAAGALGLATALAQVPYELTRAEVEALVDHLPDPATVDDHARDDARLAREGILGALVEGVPPGLEPDRSAVERLVAVLESDAATTARADAARVLGRFDSETATAALRRASEDANPNVRTAAEKALNA